MCKVQTRIERISVSNIKLNEPVICVGWIDKTRDGDNHLRNGTFGKILQPKLYVHNNKTAVLGDRFEYNGGGSGRGRFHAWGFLPL